jgi:disulfide bond formation protein DsbB
LGTGVSAVSCHSRGGLFFQVTVPSSCPICTLQRYGYLFLLVFIFVSCPNMLFVVILRILGTGYTEYYFAAESGKVCRY